MTWWNLPLARLPAEEFPCRGCGQLIVLSQELRRLRQAQIASQPRWALLFVAALGCPLVFFAVGAFLGGYPVAVMLGNWKTTILFPVLFGGVAWALIEQARLETTYERMTTEQQASRGDDD